MGRGPEETRQALLRAAAAEILEHGYFAASLSGIAGRLGLTKGALSYHFPTKDQLLDTLMDHLTQQIDEAEAVALTAFPGSPSRALVGFIGEAVFRTSTDQLTAAAMLITTEPAVAPARMQHAFDNWHMRLTALIRDAEASEQVQLTTTPENAAELLVGIITGSRLTSKYIPHSAQHPRPPYLRTALLGLGFTQIDRVISDILEACERGDVRVVPGDITGMRLPVTAA